MRHHQAIDAAACGFFVYVYAYTHVHNTHAHTHTHTHTHTHQVIDAAACGFFFTPDLMPKEHEKIFSRTRHGRHKEVVRIF